MDPIDSFDKALLSALQRDGKASTQDLAGKAGLSASPCWRRIRRLEEAGVIERYAAVLNPREVGLHALAYVHVSLIDHTEATIEKFNRFVQLADQIIECCSITGESDFVLKVAAPDPEGLEEFIMRGILGTGAVRASMTNFILRQTKSGMSLPLDFA